MTTSFPDAARRWYLVAEGECRRIWTTSAPATSYEALDHVVGLFVEAAMKALMVHMKWVELDGRGDFPPDASGRRPHVDELWDQFMNHARGRTGNDLMRKLSKQGSPVAVFQAWRSEHRYAADGTVARSTVAPRVDFAKKLWRAFQDEGLS